MKQVQLVLPALAVLLLSVASCKKESSQSYNFTQITETDASANSIGYVDSSDWGYDANWSAAETKLLSFKDTLKSSDTTIGYIHISPAFPNPSAGTFFIGADTEKGCKMKAVFVNEQFQILHYLSRNFTGGPIITVYNLAAITAFRKGHYYRMYYGFYNAMDSLYYKGHGDLRIE